MTAPSLLNWRALPLSGRQLIEASAGTGKTFTLTLLVLRALLESELRIEQIVVTTYTRAAAQELRVRLHQRLRDAQHALQAQAPRGFNDVHDYLAERAQVLGVHEAQRRVRAALLSFELANIDTLHGLCARILRDEPLAAPLAPDGDALDADALGRECLEDLWRARVLVSTPTDALDCGVLLDYGFEAVTRALRPLWARGPIAFVPAATGLDAPHAALLDALRQQENIDALRAVLADSGNAFRLNKPFGEALRELLDALVRNPWKHILPAALHRDRAAAAQHKSQHKRKIGDIAAMELVWQLADIDGPYNRARTAQALVALTQACRVEMARRARARDGYTFNDLIDATDAALAGIDGSGDMLAARLRARWPLALIDEFQDTDAQQYAICTRIWEHPDATLLLIGDPKQAIYAFRGADLNAYLAAAATLADSAHRLGVNFRSSTALIDAVNAFYVEAGADPFALAQLRFEPVASSGRVDGNTLTHADGKDYPPLRLHLAPTENGELSRDALDHWCFARCADDIASALARGGPTLGGKPLDPGNIAVLLPAHHHIATLRELLRERGVPCVGAGRVNVFDSNAAEALITLLGALLAPGDASAWRAALATPLFAATLTDFARWREDESAWALQLDAAAALAQRWHVHGIGALLGPLVADRAAAILAIEDGERFLTDLRHLLELLVVEEAAQAGAQALLTLLERARAQSFDATGADSRSLRIDSDARRVRLLTVHASKGLEFDVVYLPLAWRMGLPEWNTPTPRVLALHDHAGHAVHDAGSPDFDRNALLAAAESRAEKLRLLYVALTRARHACHVFWGRAGKPGSIQSETALDTQVAALASRYGVSATDAAWHAFAAAHPHAVAIAQAPPRCSARWQDRRASPDAELRLRGERPLRPQRWSVHSFTSVLRERERALVAVVAAPAEDEALAAEYAAENTSRSGKGAVESPYAEMGERTVEPPYIEPAERTVDPPSEIAQNRQREWHGPSFGNALHYALERVDWSEPLATQTETLLAALRESGVSAHALQALTALVERTLATPLLAGGATLRSLPRADRLAELRFDFALRRAQVARWPALFAAHERAHLLPSLPTLAPLTGILTGAIDLVLRHDGRYFVADYKSNDLGDGVDAYRGEGLLLAMQRGHYGLQLTLYQLALHRYLRQRLQGYDFERHCGGALYLFVRGLDADGSGVYRERIPRALIDALDTDCAGKVPP
ncbi:MAG: UvrD-helicase domain-containing protein [Lysobacterales bacterium]